MKASDVKLEQWFGGKNAAVVLTFDDWTAGQYDVAVPILKRFGVPATFFVPLVNLDISPNLDHWANMQRVVRDGHELANHGKNHVDLRSASKFKLFSEITDAKERLEEQLYGVTVDTFCYPYGKYDADVMQQLRKDHIAARTYQDETEGLDFAYDFASSEEDYFQIKSLRVNADMSPEQLREWVERTALKKGLMPCVLHGVFNDDHPRDQEWFDAVPETHLEKLLSVLKEQEHHVWLTTFREAVKYHRTATATRVILEDVSAGTSVIRLECDLDEPERYITPLTLTVSKTDFQSCASVQQAGQALEYEETESYVRFNANPSGEPIALELS